VGKGGALALSKNATAGSATGSPRRHADTSFRSPALPPDYLERPRLLQRLDEAFGRRLTTVVAGAGFGKSTLVRSWASDLICGWFTITVGSNALPTLVRGLGEALRASLPGLPPDVLDATHGAAGHENTDAARVATVAALLCDGIAAELAHDVVLVLDDVHELAPRSAPARLVEAICRQAPAGFHIVLVSRAEPPFSIQRLRGRGDVVELDAAALAFSEEEVAEFAVRLLGSGGTAVAASLYELTAGWPAAVRLAIEALRPAEGRQWNELLDRVRGPRGPLFGFLAEEVLAGEPTEARELIRTMAQFERFPPELCTALGVERARETLESLAQRGLFLERYEGATLWYSLHALVRRFAAERLRLDERDAQLTHARAATWFEAAGFLREALESLISAGELCRVPRLLVTHAEELFAAGAVTSVIQAGDQLTDDQRAAEVEKVLGAAYFIDGDLPRALDTFERAAGNEEQIAPELARWIGSVHYNLGELSASIATYRRARLGHDDPVEDALLLAAWSNAHALHGEPELARGLASRAMEAAEGASNDRAFAFAHHALGVVAWQEGDGREAIARYRSELKAAERCNEPMQVIRGNNNLALVLIGEGDIAEALASIEVAITLAELHAFRAEAYFVLPYALDTRAHARLHSGLLDEAGADFEAAIDILRLRGSHFAAAPLAGLGDLHRRRGQLALAKSAYQEALTLAESSGITPHLRHALAGLISLCALEEPDKAAALAGRAAALGSGDKYAAVLLAIGWAELAWGDRERADSLALEVLSLPKGREASDFAEALALRALAATEPARGVAALEQALSVWRELENPLEVAKAEYALARLADPADAHATARAKLKLLALGVPDSAAGATGLLFALGPERPPPVEIQALGGFRLLREGVAAPASEWQSKKARDLLKLLVARRGRPCPREALIEALWPDEDRSKTANRLSVALSVLRGVLDPGHAHPPEHFLRASRDAVALEVGRMVVDCDGFLAEAEAGLSAAREGRDEALELLEAAEAAYAGDFLEEDLYEDWATGPREEMRATYIAVARTLAELAGEPRIAARYLLRVLGRDRYDERAHLALVSALLRARAHGDARRAYRAYMTRMEEIGVEPAPFPAPA
jgi:ATP/maltotriose-dependent transcriptional regulator MalT/DNA-binding SARP family transcriptional activator